jgi:hypothetical protein
VLLLVLAAGLRLVGGRFGRVLAAGWLAVVALVVVAPDRFIVTLGGVAPSLAILVFAPVLALVALSGRLPVAWRAMLVWFAGPFLAAGFLVTKPHTHFYTMIPGVALLIGWGVAQVVPRVAARGRSVGWIAGGAVAGLVGLALVHQWVVFVRHDPEYKRVYPDARLPGVWSPFGDELPRGGYFGFPYRAGWRAVQAWYASGEMSGSYDSNEELLITGWYTWGAPRCAIDPVYYLIAWRPQDAEEVPDDLIARGYRTWGVVTVGGREKLRVYARNVDGPVRRVAVEDVPPPRVPSPLLVTQALELPVSPVPARTFADSIRLIGAESAPTVALTGTATVVLSWEAVAPSTRNLSSFVHLRDASGRTVAQSDHWPACGDATSNWEAGSVHYDAHVLPLSTELAPGGYDIWAGLYDAEGNAGLSVTAGAPDEVGREAVLVAPLEVRP